MEDISYDWIDLNPISVINENQFFNHIYVDRFSDTKVFLRWRPNNVLFAPILWNFFTLEVSKTNESAQQNKIQIDYLNLGTITIGHMIAFAAFYGTDFLWLLGLFIQFAFLIAIKLYNILELKKIVAEKLLVKQL